MGGVGEWNVDAPVFCCGLGEGNEIAVDLSITRGTGSFVIVI